MAVRARALLAGVSDFERSLRDHGRLLQGRLRLGVIASPECRLPLAPIADATKAAVDKALSHAGLLAVAALLLGYATAQAFGLHRRARRFERYRGYDRSPR